MGLTSHEAFAVPASKRSCDKQSFLRDTLVFFLRREGVSQREHSNEVNVRTCEMPLEANIILSSGSGFFDFAILSL